MKDELVPIDEETENMIMFFIWLGRKYPASIFKYYQEFKKRQRT